MKLSELRQLIREEVRRVIKEAGETVVNPKTGRTIKVTSALGYDKSHPAYKAAVASMGPKNKTNTPQSNKLPTKKEVDVVQNTIDNNKFLKGTKVKPEDVVIGKNNTLYRSSDSATHIAARHKDTSIPGSTFTISDNEVDNLITQAMDKEPIIQDNGTYRFEIEAPKPIGGMGVSYKPDMVKNAKNYNMRNPKNPDESVKVVAGTRDSTNKMTVIAAPIGKDANGKPLFSLITAYPGGSTVKDNKGNDIEIPTSRSEFAKNGLVFVTDNGVGRD
jgi:hypothetical protein